MNGLIWKTAVNLVSPAGGGARLSILIYHQVLPDHDPFRRGNFTAEQFDQQMSFVSSNFNVLSLEEAVEKLQENVLPERSLAITFDDGYLDNATLALPILKKYSLNATFFIATGFLNGGRMWNDTIIEIFRSNKKSQLNLEFINLPNYRFSTGDERLYACKDLISRLKYMEMDRRLEYCELIEKESDSVVPDNLMMRDEDVIYLKNEGMKIGAHTVQHPILSRIEMGRSFKEIDEGKRVLESLLNEKISLFAYPNGVPNIDYRAEHIGILKELGFKAAVTTSPGVSDRNSDIYQLPRFTPWDKTLWRFGIRMLMNYRNKGEVVSASS